MYRLPGGKLRPGEDEAAGLKRKLNKRLAPPTGSFRCASVRLSRDSRFAVPARLQAIRLIGRLASSCANFGEHPSLVHCMLRRLSFAQSPPPPPTPPAPPTLSLPLRSIPPNPNPTPPRLVQLSVSATARQQTSRVPQSAVVSSPAAISLCRPRTVPPRRHPVV